MSGAELEETGFVIDGETYPVPTLDSFDMDEAQILYDLTGLTVEDFVQPDDDEDEDVEAKELRAEELTRKVKNPAFLRAVMAVTYRRRHTKLPRKAIDDIVARVNMVDAMGQFLRATAKMAAEGDPRVPPASATEQQQQSSTSSVASNGSSGTDSETDSGEPGSPPETTGTMKSRTSRTSGRKASAR